MTMKRRLHPFAILGTTVLGFALVGVGWYKYTEAQSALTVEAELEKLRAMGVPTTYAEFAEFAPKPGSDNSASLYERAIDEIVAIGLPTRPSIMTSWKIDPAKRKAYLVKTQSAHDALVLATKGGDCVFERDWRLGFRLAFPEYRALTALAEMVSIRAELASESQDWDQMFGELSVMKRMATQVREPTLLSILMTTSYEARWLRPIELALNSYFDDPGFLASARRALDEPQKPIDLRSAFCAEVASLRDAVNFAVTPSSGTSSFRGRYDEWALRHPKSRHVIYATALRELRMILDGSMEDPALPGIKKGNAKDAKSPLFVAKVDPKSMLRADEATLCGSCHGPVLGEFRHTSHHPVPEGSMVCSDCHVPHPTKDSKVRKDAVKGQCVTCHTEMAGPFVFQHDPVTGHSGDGCQECHKPHGSSNPKMLNSNTRGLCAQCHTEKLGRHYPGQSCWNAGCHVAPHGSNTDPRFLKH